MSIRILVTEDDHNTRTGLAALLEMDGHHVDACDSAGDALVLLRHHAYDLLLTDHVMPGTSGLELTRAALSLQPQIRCVVMSGVSCPEPTNRIVTWINKPIDIDSLLQECARLTPRAKPEALLERALS